MRILALASTLAALCPAQQTWIVDQQGTGHFTDLALAIASAAPGDTLILRNGGTYASTTHTVDKVLHFVGETPRATVPYLYVEIRTLGADPATFSNLAITNLFIGSQQPVLVPVVFENVAADRVETRGSTVTMNRCTITGGLTSSLPFLFPTLPGLFMVGGQVALSECSVSGPTIACGYPSGISGPAATTPGTPAIVINAGSLELAKCTVRGSDGGAATGCAGAGSVPGMPGIRVFGSIVRVSGGLVAAGALSSQPTAIETTSATALVDPSTVLLGSSSAILKFLPRMVANGAAPGGTLQCSLEGPTNLPAAVLLSVLVRAPFPFFEGNIWLDANQFMILSLGSTGPSGVLTSAIGVPAAIPPGISVTLQGGVVLAGASDWIASLPAAVLVL